MLSQSSNGNARWEVLWLGKRGITRKAFEHDFSEALRTYVLLKSNGKKLVTLRCCNVGFPPPSTITASPVTTWRVVTRGGRRYKKKEITYVDRMPELNREGILWCPYCIALRPYKIVKEYRQVLMVCPVCRITSRDFHVRRHNPQASVIEYRRVRAPRARSRNGRQVRRRAKQR